jgi:hypothetical protein
MTGHLQEAALIILGCDILTVTLVFNNDVTKMSSSMTLIIHNMGLNLIKIKYNMFVWPSVH